MVVGQLINAFLTGGADPDNSSVVITDRRNVPRNQLRRMLRKVGGRRLA